MGSYATNASYYANGIVRGYDTPNWLTLWQTLDAQQRLKKREVHGGGNHVVELSYTYDANHNIQSIIDGVNGTHSVTGLSYDGLDRLVAATGHWGQGSFSYDSNGNIVTRQLGSASDTYHYDSAKRLTHISGSTARNFSYDNRGNVISNGQRSFSFNRAGQISGSGGISYRYDGHGRRVAKTISGSTTYSYYSQDGQLLGTYADGDYTDYYYLGREMVARYSDSTQSDAPGYTGHVEDDDLGLVYMQQRYYDANIGRFYSNDPIGFRDIHSFNRYAYANNNPYKYIDPSGMCSNAPGTDANDVCQSASNLNISQKGIDHIKKSENDTGNLSVQDDGLGNPTAGYGHKVTPQDNLKMNDPISQSKADSLLAQDIAIAEGVVENLVGSLPVSQNEFDALTDLAFNVGAGKLSPQNSPGLNAAIKAGDYEGMSNNLKYTRGVNKQGQSLSLPGLATRSAERRTIFRGNIQYKNP